MPCLMIKLGIKQRLRLGNVLSFLCVVQVLTAWMTCLSELYFEFNVKWAVDLFDKNISYWLQKLIATTGLASFVVYAIGTKIYFDSGHERTRSRFTSIFQLWNVLLCSLITLKSITIIYSSWCISSFANNFRVGFLVAIENYLNDTTVKEHVDYLQSEYKCCGADSFKDWMVTPWIPSDYNIFTKLPGDKGRYKDFYKDMNNVDHDVSTTSAVTPFSCCDFDKLVINLYFSPPKRIFGPCIHDFVTQKAFAETIKDKWWLGLSLWGKGCGEVFQGVYNSFLNFVHQLTLTTLCLDIFMMILFRYLQKSVEMLELSPNQRGIAPGWLCDCCTPSPFVEADNTPADAVYFEKSKKKKHKHIKI